MPEDSVEQDLIAKVTEMYGRWKAKDGSKSQLEIEYFQDATAHGRLFTRLVKKHLGEDTVIPSAQTVLLQKMRRDFHLAGRTTPDETSLGELDELIAKSRQAAIQAIRTFNDPTASFRTDNFIILMTIAWNCVFQAVLIRDGDDIFDRNNKDGTVLIEDGHEHVLDITRLAKKALDLSTDQPVYENIRFFVGLRRLVEHRILPAIDAVVLDKAQAMLMNYEAYLATQCGEDASLADMATVPLQISYARSDNQLASLAQLEASLPPEIQAYLSSSSAGLSEEVRSSTRYGVRWWLVPVTSNHQNSADAVVHFVEPEQVTDELIDQLAQMRVVVRYRPVPVEGVGHELRPAQVARRVEERIPFIFSPTPHHFAAAIHYGARPASSAQSREATNREYCIYSRISKSYGYSEAWVEFLIHKLTDPAEFLLACGQEPKGDF
jgi:hypothetical protein